MRKRDMTAVAVTIEIICAILGIAYCGLQIYYGYYYRVNPLTLILNLLVAILVYAGLSMLSCYPERLNALDPEVCIGKIRKYSIRLIRLVKVVFTASLLVPCVSDAFGYQMDAIYSLVVVALVVIIAVFYEVKILKLINEIKK